MRLFKVVIALLLTCSLSGCRRYYLEVSQLIINRDYLASTHVCSPDPRQHPPPYGRRLIISWQVPVEIMEQNPHIDLDVMFWNYTQERVTYVLDAKRGYVLYTLVGNEYLEKGGILSYKAQLITECGQVYRSWKQQLWVDLITVDEEEYLPPPQPAFPESGEQSESQALSSPNPDTDLLSSDRDDSL